MLSASVFALVSEGLATGQPVELVTSLAAGVVLVVAHDIVEDADVSPRKYEEADFRTLLLYLGFLTSHSFPKGVAVGVAFAALGFDGGMGVLGVAVLYPPVRDGRLGLQTRLVDDVLQSPTIGRYSRHVLLRPHRPRVPRVRVRSSSAQQ